MLFDNSDCSTDETSQRKKTKNFLDKNSINSFEGYEL